MESPETSEAIGSILSSLGMVYDGKIYDLAIYSSSMLDRLLGPAEREYQRVIVARRNPESTDQNVLKAILSALGHTKVAFLQMPMQVVRPAAPQVVQTVTNSMQAAAKVVKPGLVPATKPTKVVAKLKKVTAPKPPKTPTIVQAGQQPNMLRPGSFNPTTPTRMV